MEARTAAIVCALAALVATSPVAAQSASEMSVYDANGHEFGRIYETEPTFVVTTFSSNIAGLALIGDFEHHYRQRSAFVSSLPGYGGVPGYAVFFAGAHCTGQAYVMPEIYLLFAPRRIEPLTIVQVDVPWGDFQLYAGSRTAPDVVVDPSSFIDTLGACQDFPATGLDLVPATFVGSFHTPPSPWRIGPASTVTASATASSVPVAAVTPAALAFLAALLLLSGIAFLGARARR